MPTVETSPLIGPDAEQSQMRPSRPWPPWLPPDSPGPYDPIPIFEFLEKHAGVSAGDLHGKIVRELQRQGETTSNDPVRTTQDSLVRLSAKGMLTPLDVERLGNIARIAASKKGAADMLVAIRRIHVDMLDDETTKPLALAIASIAIDSALTAATSANSPVVGADIGGAAGGALFGGFIGAVVCGALASYTASKFE